MNQHELTKHHERTLLIDDFQRRLRELTPAEYDRFWNDKGDDDD